MKNKIKIAFIGCGNMAKAIIDSMTNVSAREALKTNGDVLEIIAADPDEAKLMPVKTLCAVTTDNAAAVGSSDYVFLSVKPQTAEEALSSLDLSHKTIISIMAGVTIEKLKSLTHSARIVRVMPNLNARVGESVNAYVACGIAEEQKHTIASLLGCFGKPYEVKESDMDAVTGISGSGPAFVFMAIKAFYDEAKAQGFNDDVAKSLAVQTFIGSALTVEHGAAPLDKLIDSVCSKGGTTIEGVNHLKDSGFEETLRTAIQKAIKRSEEMSRQ